MPTQDGLNVKSTQAGGGCLPERRFDKLFRYMHAGMEKAEVHESRFRIA